MAEEGAKRGILSSLGEWAWKVVKYGLPAVAVGEMFRPPGKRMELPGNAEDLIPDFSRTTRAANATKTTG